MKSCMALDLFWTGLCKRSKTAFLYLTPSRQMNDILKPSTPVARTMPQRRTCKPKQNNQSRKKQSHHRVKRRILPPISQFLNRVLVMCSPTPLICWLGRNHASIWPGHLLLLVLLLLQLSLELGQIVEPWMLQGFTGSNAHFRAQLQHAVQQV